MSTEQQADSPSATSNAPTQVGDKGTAASDGTTSPVEHFSTLICFPKLPLELRLAIWKFAAFEPRNVEVCASNYWNKPGAPNYHDGSLRLLPHFFSTCPIPGLLDVNQESREEGLKHFQADFGISVPPSGDPWEMHPPSFPFEPRIYVNWKVDRICLMNSCNTPSLFRRFLFKAEEKEVESMAICVGSARNNPRGRGVVHPDDGSVHLQWIYGREELDRAMYSFPFHDSLKELILFNHAFDHKLRLTSQRLKTTIDFNPFNYERETTLYMHDKEDIIDLIGLLVDRYRDWRFTAYDDDDHVAEKIPGIDDLKSEDDADANSQAEDCEDIPGKILVERTVSVKLREIFIKNRA